mmetsp:Transcript_17273/g.28264  ORF Transcript_17273/g.28264 Transcript_17273/m.28264 type:complete len:240 (-) Transcript_17273:92-811(-)
MAMKIPALLISTCVWALLPQATLAFAPIASRSSTLQRNTHKTSTLSLCPLPLQDIDYAANNLITNSAALSSSLDLSAGILTTENIKQAFSVATFFPQIWWLFLIVLPKSGITKKLMGGYEILTITSLVHFFIVTASIAQPDGTAPMAEFADVFDPAGDPQKAMVGMMQYPNFVSEEWSHVLTWDLFVGRWIWLDGLKRGIFTSHSVLLCNLIGPPGLLLHWATCLVTRKGLPGNEAIDE